MKKLVAIMLLLSPSAFAQEVVVQDFCGFLPQYQMPAGVEYIPESEAVVAADIHPLGRGVPEVINIPITVKLAERFPDLGIPTDLELQPNVGMLSIQQDGHVFYNGQDVTTQVMTTCTGMTTKTGGAEAPVVVETALDAPSNIAAQTDGQAPADPVKSEPKLIEIREGIQGEVLDGQYP